MSDTKGSIAEAMRILVENPPKLSGDAQEFLRQHPQEARMIVTVALETAAAKRAANEGLPDAGVPVSRWSSIPSRRDYSEIIGTSEAASRLQVSNSTIYVWVRQRVLVHWRSAQGGLLIPAAQILGPGRLVPGLTKVFDTISDGELTWTFLTREWPFEGVMTKPIELLETGQTHEVLAAAHGFGRSVT